MCVCVAVCVNASVAWLKSFALWCLVRFVPFFGTVNVHTTLFSMFFALCVFSTVHTTRFRKIFVLCVCKIVHTTRKPNFQTLRALPPHTHNAIFPDFSFVCTNNHPSTAGNHASAETESQHSTWFVLHYQQHNHAPIPAGEYTQRSFLNFSHCVHDYPIHTTPFTPIPLLRACKRNTSIFLRYALRTVSFCMSVSRVACLPYKP